MDIYFSYTIYATDEALLGLLTQFEFESFEENEDHIVGYIHSKELNDDVKEQIAQTINLFTENFQVDEIQPQNWNEIWEASFQPVIVDDFCQIRAEFHPANPNIKHDLVINPKMAFGTGHHATTYMMIKQMDGIDFMAKNVFDFGCGTGILAILASKLGANHIDAIDIEQESYLNTIENSQINQVENVTSICGDLADAPESKYEVILANINRNILVRYVTPLVERLEDGGVLLLSGVLVDDKELVINTYTQAGLNLNICLEREGWICASMTKQM
ncbi:MAG TPA: 50S ribosomal protein L11 methyltransferase [Saprospiraceae bacterium]|nr:50S ribosomal protein L11 methyltransferase [Saprospiraceae bacterium]